MTVVGDGCTVIGWSYEASDCEQQLRQTDDFSGEARHPDNVLGDVLRNTKGDWGDWRAPINPLPATETFGRTEFFLHGGALPGSAGCIDVGGGLFGNDATDQLLRDILNDPDGLIPVRVK